MFVNVNYHTNAGKVGDTVRYVAHREETLPEGRTREIYGIGPRYRELKGDEQAIVRRLRADAEGIRQPHFFRAKFTVDDAVAGRLLALPAPYREWAIRDAVEKTFAGAFRTAQGAFVIHYHGGARRPFGHPHAHAVLSPRLQDGLALQYIPRTRLALIKDRWDHEVTRAVSRFEQRLYARVGQRSPAWSRRPGRTRPATLTERLIELAALRAATTALGRPAGALLRSAADARAIRRGPAGIFQRVAPRIAETIAPGPLRTALRAVRLWGRLTGGNGNGRDE